MHDGQRSLVPGRGDTPARRESRDNFYRRSARKGDTNPWVRLDTGKSIKIEKSDSIHVGFRFGDWSARFASVHGVQTFLGDDPETGQRIQVSRGFSIRRTIHRQILFHVRKKIVPNSTIPRCEFRKISFSRLVQRPQENGATRIR